MTNNISEPSPKDMYLLYFYRTNDVPTLLPDLFAEYWNKKDEPEEHEEYLVTRKQLIETVNAIKTYIDDDHARYSAFLANKLEEILKDDTNT